MVGPEAPLCEGLVDELTEGACWHMDPTRALRVWKAPRLS